MSETLTLPEKMVRGIETADAALRKAAQELEPYRNAASGVAELTPACVDALVEHERITPDQRDKVAEMLQDPAEVIRLLTKLAAHRNRDEQASLGHGIKSASDSDSSYKSTTDPHVGRRTSRVKESDAKLFEGLGLPVPQD